MLTLLVNSYACCPGMGSEPGMGWNWISALARYCEIYVISEGEFRKSVESFLNQEIQKNSEKSSEYDRWAERIHFYWIPVSDKMRRRCWNQGNWLFYFGYERWQRKVEVLARNIVREHKIDVLYQLNMIGFREPGYLWRVSKDTGIPFVWGPIGGMKSFPMSYANGLKMKLFWRVKNIINKWQIKYDSRVTKALHQASLLISSIPDSYSAIKEHHDLESVIIPETGTTLVDAYTKCIKDHSFSVVWIGKFDYRKRIDIALHSVRRIVNSLPPEKSFKLYVYGTGSEQQQMKINQQIADLHLCDYVAIMGAQPHEVVVSAMQSSHILLFTSVNEDTSTVVLEALENGLPVVCFDACGMSSVLPSSGDIKRDCGIKIPLSTPEQSVRDFADAIVRLEKNRELLSQMSKNCRRRAEELTWDKKAQQVVSMLHDIC